MRRRRGGVRASFPAVASHRDRRDVGVAVLIASVVAALLPIIVATVRAIARGWIPVGENALIAIRARDVLGEHHPLIGTSSSASMTGDTELHHPGPLLFDVLAAPAPLVDGGGGIALGVALVNALAVLGIALFAYRRGGPVVATAAMAVTATLAWSMGSELLFDPWNPNVVVLPFLFFLVLVWSVSCGDLIALPVAAGAGSLVLQTHLSYVVLVPALAGWAVVGLALDVRRKRLHDHSSWPALRRRVWRSGGVAAVVLALCWLQPLLEQFTSDGPGNLTRLVNSRTELGSTIGFSAGIRMVAGVVAMAPWWLRPSFSARLLPSPPIASAVLSLVVVTGILVGCAWHTRRQGDRHAARLVVTGAVALVAALVTAARSPADSFILAPHKFRWLWSIGAFVTLAIVATGVRWLTRKPRPRAWLVHAFVAVAIVFSALNLPMTDQSASWSGPSIRVARELGRELNGLRVDGTVLVEEPAGFGDPYTYAVIAELQRQGIPFVVDGQLASQLGSGRRFTGHNARTLLCVELGEGIRVAPQGTRRIAAVELTRKEQEELADLRARISEYLRRVGGVRLNARGQAALRDGLLPTVAQDLSRDEPDPEQLLLSREFAFLVEGDLLMLDDQRAGWFRRYVELQTRLGNEAVALFLGPLPDDADPGTPQCRRD